MLLAELLQLTLLAPLGIACSCCLSSLGIFCHPNPNPNPNLSSLGTHPPPEP